MALLLGSPSEVRPVPAVATSGRAVAAPNSDLAQSPENFSITPGTRSNSTEALEVAAQPPVPVDDPVAVVEDDDLATADEDGGHFEIAPLRVVSPDDGQEVQVEGRVHGAKRLSGEIEGARLPEHALGENFDTPPARRSRASEDVEKGLLGQLPDADLGELRGNPATQSSLRGHFGRFSHSGSGNTCTSRDNAARRSAAMIIVGLNDPASASQASRVDGCYSSGSWSRVSLSIEYVNHARCGTRSLCAQEARWRPPVRVPRMSAETQCIESLAPYRSAPGPNSARAKGAQTTRM